MTSQDQLFETIAKIFAVTVLVDGHERAPEMLEFVHACTVHNKILRKQRITPPEELTAWYHATKPAILEGLEREGDPYKISLLSQITDADLRRSILSSMFTISVADHEFHGSENALIKIALATWDAVPPSPAELDKVA